jgi:hypothetical protein
MRLCRPLFLASLVTVATGYSAQANLVVNGSFETGSFQVSGPYGDPGTDQVLWGSQVIQGWSITGGYGGDIAWLKNSSLSQGNPWALQASDGNYFLDLTGYYNDHYSRVGGVGQSISTTVGQSYAVSFDLGSSYYYDGSKLNAGLEVLVNGLPVYRYFTADADLSDTPGYHNHWQHLTFCFVAQDGNTRILFQGVNPDGTVHLGLDNVSMCPTTLLGPESVVPEPSTCLAGAILLVPLGIAAIRKTRSKQA